MNFCYYCNLRFVAEACPECRGANAPWQRMAEQPATVVTYIEFKWPSWHLGPKIKDPPAGTTEGEGES